jgi:hypothetical protein
VDDLEDGDALTEQVFGATGSWYVSNSGEGLQFPSASRANAVCGVSSPAQSLLPHASAFAIHTYGSGFGSPPASSSWAQVGIGFRLGPECDQPLDASGATGITFWVRGSSEQQNVRFSVATTATTGVADGGTCTTGCYDYHGLSLAVGSGWVQYFVPFSALEQEPWGFAPVAFDPATILNLIWDPQAPCFDYWLDDVAFYRDG